MPNDAYGLPVTASREALATYDRAVRALLGWQADALDLFRAATALDPGLALAHAGAAVCLFLEERFGETKAAADAARAAAVGQSERERSHVEALTLWTSGRADDAVTAMRAHLATYPRDVMVVQRLYYIFFWQGRFPEMLEMSQAMLPHYPGESFLLGMHAFALEEADRCAEGVRAAEAALSLNPHDAWAVHALAHSLYESADFDSGVTRIPAAIDPCRGLNWFRNHLLWHVALLHFARGEYERAEQMSRSVFEQAPSSIPGDLHDSISLLWRLEMAGRKPGERWQPFTAIARERMNRQGLHFHTAHMAMALAAGGDWPGAEQHLATMRERAPKDRTGAGRRRARAAGRGAARLRRRGLRPHRGAHRAPASADHRAGRQPRAARRVPRHALRGVLPQRRRRAGRPLPGRAPRPSPRSLLAPPRGVSAPA